MNSQILNDVMHVDISTTSQEEFNTEIVLARRLEAGPKRHLKGYKILYKSRFDKC